MLKSKSKSKYPETSKNVEMPECELCCNEIGEDEDCLKCEGACDCVMYRYCAGVTTAHFGSQYCELSLAMTVYQQLRSELQALKVELGDVKRALQEDTKTTKTVLPAATAPAPPAVIMALSCLRISNSERRIRCYHSCP